MVDHSPASTDGNRLDSTDTDDRTMLGTSRRTLLQSLPALGALSAPWAVERGAAAVDRTTVDTTSAQDASFSGSDGDYTIEAAGKDVWKNADEYGAIYEPEALTGAENTVAVTVESQENTHAWAKAGVMVSNDITAAGSSPGDVIVAVTPENGVTMQWDADGNGFIDSSTKTGTSTTSCRVKIERSGDTFTGYYSTDGGATFTQIDSVTIPEASSEQDAGLFATSHDKGNRSTVSYSRFVVGPLDRIIFGNAHSESVHDLQAETSQVIEGKDGKMARQILKAEGHEDGLGSVSFTVDCDPDERTYLTLKLEASPDENLYRGRPARIMLFDGDKIIGYKRNAEWPPANYKRVIGGQQHSEWLYATMRLPTYLTDGQESVQLRLVNWEERDQPTEPLYRAYTHTDPMFARPEDEETTTEYDLGTLAGPQDSYIDPVQTDVNNGVDRLQTNDTVNPRQTYALGLAHTRSDWIDTADPDAILDTITATIDYYAIEQVDYDNPLDLFQGWRSWNEHGWLAQGFNEVAETLEAKGLLSEPLDGHPEDTRREAYTQFFHRALWWRATNRKVVHNQVMIITLNLVRTHRALETLDPDRYPATVGEWVDPDQYPVDGVDFEKEIQPAEMTPPAAPDDPVVERWIDEALGLAAMTDAWLGWDILDDDWYTASAIGMPNEFTGFAASYSGVSMVRVSRLAYEENSERIQERALEILQAKLAMSWWVKLNGNRYAGFDGTFGSRKRFHAFRNGGHGYGRFPLLNFLAAPDDVTQAWAELFLETGTDPQPWELQQKILHVEAYHQLQDETRESAYAVPMDRDGYIWSDEEVGIISVIDGDTTIKAELGQGGWEVPAVGEAARVHYHGPRGDRILTTDLHRNEFQWGGSTWTRPETLKHANRSLPAYAPWLDDTIPVDHALAGEEVKQAAQPSGEEWANPMRKNLNVQYREVEIENYLIGMNSTGAQIRGFEDGKEFEMAVPDGTVVDVETGETVSGETVTVRPQSTRVLRKVRTALGWKNAADWDNAPRESGVAHELTANTDHQNPDTLKQGYPVASPSPASASPAPASLDRYYPLHEDSGRTVYDLGTDGQNGTNQGGSQGQPFIPGTTGYNYNGSDEYTTYPSTGNLMDGSNDFSVNLWVNPDSLTSAEQTIWSGKDDYNITIQEKNSDYIFELWDGGTLHQMTWNSPPSGWVMLTAVFDADGNMQLYGNASSQASQSSASPAGVTSDMVNTIGADGGNTVHGFWPGSVAELRIYSTALSSSQVQSLYDVVDTAASLERYYPLQEDSGRTVHDLGTDGQNGTNQGGTQGQTGILGTTAYNYNGSDEYSTYPSVGSLFQESNDWSVNLWVNPDSLTSAEQTIWSGKDDANITIAEINSDYRFEVYDGSNTYQLDWTSPPSGWVMLTATFDADGDMQLYGNATSQASQSSATPADTPSDRVNTIGADGGGSIHDFWPGSVAELRIYSTVLSSSEVQALYDVANTAGSLETTTRSFASAQTPDLRADVDLNGVTDVAVDVIGSPTGTSETQTVPVTASGERTYSIPWSNSHTDFRVRPKPHNEGDVTRTPEIDLLELVI